MAKQVKRKKRTELPNIGYGKTVASVVGGAVSVIALYFLQKWAGPFPEAVSGAIQTVITSAAVFLTHHTIFEKVALA